MKSSILSKTNRLILLLTVGLLLQGLAVKASTNCHQYRDIVCGHSQTYDTKFGHTNNHDYSCFHHSLTGFHAKEIIYKIDRSHIDFAHDIEITLTDNFGRGLDAFIVENCGKSDARCHSYKENFGNKYKFVVEDANPHKEYYVIIDAKSVTGEFRISTFCRKKEFKCSFAQDIDCGETKFGDTHDGSANYSDYTCFDHDQFGYYGKELVYKITNRSSTNSEDIEITLEDLDGRGLDIFILENCGRNDYRCLRYKRRTSSSPKRETITIFDASPHKDYHVIIDAQNRDVTGRFNLTVFCKRDQFFCHDAKDIRCGETKFGNTHDGFANYDDYSCFHPDLTGFHAKELVYKIIDRPDVHHDINIELEDLDHRGLDVFIVENCGQDHYECYDYVERSGSETDNAMLTIFNSDPDKEYYVIVDAKSVTGRFNLSIFCEEEGLLCEDATEIFCGQSLDGNSNSMSISYELGCFDESFANQSFTGVLYEVEGRPFEVHDLEIQINDKDQVGLDIFVFENCGDENATCLDYYIRDEFSPKRDVFVIPNTDPDKTYHIMVTNTDGDHGEYRLSVLCEKEPACFDACFHYVRKANGHFDFSFPDGSVNGTQPHHWSFENVVTQEQFDEEGRDLFNYELTGENTFYRVSIRDEFDNELCYLFVQISTCAGGSTEARAFSVEEGICTADFPTSSCNYTLDASSSVGADLIYHWFLEYENTTRNVQYTSFKSDTTIGVAYPDSLTAICLVVVSSCGMSSFCWRGECAYTVEPYFEIEEMSDNQIVLNLLDKSVPCTSTVSIVTIDWGDGTFDDYDLHEAWDQPETYPRHTYSQSGDYYISVRLPYRCNELNGEFDTRTCVICLSYAVRIGHLEDDENCDYLEITPGAFLETGRVYDLDVFPPPGYEFKGYRYGVITDLPLIIDFDLEGDSVILQYGLTYRIFADFDKIGSTDQRFVCSRPILVEYPAEEIILEADHVCGAFGEMVEIPIRVSNFQEVTGLQFRLDLVDKNIAQIKEIDFLNEDLPVNFGDVQLDTAFNRLQFAWTSPQAEEAKSLPDQSILFVLRALITGSPGDTASVEFSDAFAFNNIKDLQIPVTTVFGSICIEANFSISGRVYTEDDFSVPEVSVFLNGPTPQTDTTDQDGLYRFDNLGGGDFEVGAYRDDDFRRGVNVIDLALLKAYNRSFGEMGLSTPYKLLAANLRKQLDASNISVADETAMKRLIAFDIDRLEEYETPWIFVTKDHQFSDPKKANLEEYQSTYDFDPLDQDWQDRDFIAVKIADIDGSASKGNPTRRSAGIVTLIIDTLQVASTEEISVQIKADELINIQNLQFTVQWDPSVLQYIGTDSSLVDLGLDESSFSTRFIDDGILTFVHSLAPGSVTINDTSLFSINFLAIGEEGTSSEISIVNDPVEILITDDVLTPQTVISQSGLVMVQMATPTADFSSDDFQVGIHWPNPFKETMQIPVTSSQAEIISFSVYDLLGRKIITREEPIRSGKNFISINGKNLQGPGQYFFRIRTAQGEMARSFIYFN